MGLFSQLFSKRNTPQNPLKWDMHNHILFGIDDGSKTIENSLLMARQYLDSGYTKIIATPHIMSNYYDNTREIISSRREILNKALIENNINLELDCAAEYYIDEFFLEKVRNKEKLLSFNNGHILVETSFLNKPIFFNELIFDLRTNGYIPIFAHPERYVYLHNNYEEVERILESGIKFQINLLSLVGYYSPMVKKLAQWMVQKGYYSFLGTDAHSTNHLALLPAVFSSKLFEKIDFSKVENCN